MIFSKLCVAFLAGAVVGWVLAMVGISRKRLPVSEALFIAAAIGAGWWVVT